MSFSPDDWASFYLQGTIIDVCGRTRVEQIIMLMSDWFRQHNKDVLLAVEFCRSAMSGMSFWSECSATELTLYLFLLSSIFRIRRIVVSTSIGKVSTTLMFLADSIAESETERHEEIESYSTGCTRLAVSTSCDEMSAFVETSYWFTVMTEHSFLLLFHKNNISTDPSEFCRMFVRWLASISDEIVIFWCFFDPFTSFQPDRRSERMDGEHRT